MTALQLRQRRKYYNYCANVKRVQKRKEAKEQALMAEQSLIKKWSIIDWDADKAIVGATKLWGYDAKTMLQGIDFKGNKK